MTKSTCFHRGRLLNGIWNIFTTWPNDQFQMNCSTCQITPASLCAIWATSLSSCCMAITPRKPHGLRPLHPRRMNVRQVRGVPVLGVRERGECLHARNTISLQCLGLDDEVRVTHLSNNARSC